MADTSLVKYTVEEALEYHRNNFSGNGKIEVISKTPARNKQDLTLAYSPGVAETCRAISENPELVHDFTAKDNMIAVVTDGTAILGLGDIGPAAGHTVMEGKAVLFKMLAGVDAFPISLGTTDTEEIIHIVKMIATGFGGINLEDIAAPRCFEILGRLRKEMDIPVFHDDQHGTAVVVLAGMINALKVSGKEMKNVKVVVNGAGASGIACALLLHNAGVEDIILCDTRGAIYKGREENMNPFKDEVAEITNLDKIRGSLADAMQGADVFMGLSIAKQVDQDMVKSMSPAPIIMAMANPEPEIMPEDAQEAGAAIVATGRSDYPNQMNNVLGFPGIFRGALDVRATDVNEEMMVAAAHAIAGLVSENELKEDYIITSPVDPRVMPTEAAAVAKAAMDTGVARKQVDAKVVYEETRKKVEICNKRFDYTEKLLKEYGIAK